MDFIRLLSGIEQPEGIVKVWLFDWIKGFGLSILLKL